jgi:hypothetical protein
MTWNKSYSELSLLETFDERFEYLRLGGGVGQATFGFDRHVNQVFYSSREWEDIRQYVILRDNGCDLGVSGYEIHVSPLIHHINPMAVQDILDRSEWILNPEFLVTTTHSTHNAIHYGSPSPYPKIVLQRSPGDTRLW